LDNKNAHEEDWVKALRREIEQNPRGYVKRRYKTIINKYGARNKTRIVDNAISKLLHENEIETYPDIHVAKREEYISLSLRDISSKVADVDVSDKEKCIIEKLVNKKLDTELSVSIRFVVPLLELLGYSEDDRSDGHKVQLSFGSKKKNLQADFVLFDGRNRANSNSLLLVEVKAVGKDLKDAVGQARSYAMWIGAPFYLVTNGEEIRIFYFRKAYQPDQELFYGKRSDLNEETFKSIYSHISKDSIIKLKTQLQ